MRQFIVIAFLGILGFITFSASHKGMAEKKFANNPTSTNDSISEEKDFLYLTRQEIPFAEIEAFRLKLDFSFEAMPKPDPGNTVTTRQEFVAKIANAQPGGVIYIRNGTYSNWNNIDIRCSGVADNPIIIAPETRHGVRFTDNMSIQLHGSYIIFSGFLFDHVGHNTAPYSSIIGLIGDYNRVTGNIFASCGYDNDASEKGANYHIQVISNNGRMDHNYFFDRYGEVLKVTGSEEMFDNDLPGMYLFDHNIIRDARNVAKLGFNTSAIFCGQGGPRNAFVMTRVVSEYNIFDYEVGDKDREIFTDKSSGNIWRYNVFANGPGRISFRQGNNTSFYGNVAINCNCSVEDNSKSHNINGKHHLIVNNYFINNSNSGISLVIGDIVSVQERVKEEYLLLKFAKVENTIIAHNMFINNQPLGIGHNAYNIQQLQKPGMEEKIFDWPEDNYIFNNIIQQDHGIFMDIKGSPDNFISTNLFYGNARTETEGADLLMTDPMLTDDLLPVLQEGSPAKDRGISHESLPGDFYENFQNKEDPTIDLGVIDYGRYAFDYENIPYIPASPDVLTKLPVKARIELLPANQSPGKYIVFDGGVSRGEIVKYTWDFGDGTGMESGIGVIPHYYEKPGAYDVKLTVEDVHGGTSSVNKKIIIVTSDRFCFSHTSPVIDGMTDVSWEFVRSDTLKKKYLDSQPRRQTFLLFLKQNGTTRAYIC